MNPNNQTPTNPFNALPALDPLQIATGDGGAATRVQEPQRDRGPKRHPTAEAIFKNDQVSRTTIVDVM
jgi:hypothetical protein